ncbi:MAG TPA: hypothetical protein VN516_07210, partial [Candidatus Baltobacteraceae bacterium]|nr:hypothetical protein [Candidatus Baltobacteraceae bacterium]
MKRPFVPVVVSYATGLFLAEIFHPSVALLFTVSISILVAAFVLEKFRSYLIWPLLVMMGWTNLASRIEIISPNDLRTLMGKDAQIVTVRGTLPETPGTRIYFQDEEEIQRSVATV